MKLTEKLAWLSVQMRRRDVSSGAKVVLFSLVERSDVDGTCYPSVARIAADCGLARSGAGRCLKELVEIRVLGRRQRRSSNGDLDTSLYRIAFGGSPEIGITPSRNEDDGSSEFGTKGNPESRTENPPRGTQEEAQPTSSAARSPEGQLFEIALSMLVTKSEGRTDRDGGRRFLGLLMKGGRKRELLSKLGAMVAEDPVDPRAWLVGAMSNGRGRPMTADDVERAYGQR